MFDLILALFGIGYYGSKIAGEKIDKKYYGIKREVYDSIEKQIRLNLSDPAYKPPETREQFWIMCESISEDLRYIFGDDWRTKLNFPLVHYYKGICEKQDVVRHMFIHPIQVAYQVWLSKKGKYDFTYSDGYHRYAYDGVNNPETQAFVTRICKTIEKNMQEAHPDLPLRLVVNKFKPYFIRWEHFYTAIDIYDLERPW